MFTGLVTDVGTIEHVASGETLRRVRIRSHYAAVDLSIGASVACGGPCLTLVGIDACAEGSTFAVDVGAETLARTSAASWREGMRLNLERSLRVGDELGGHIVTGHIDGLAEILSIEPFDGMSRFVLRAPPHLLRFIAEKGSVCLDGTSLTVNGVAADTFTILLIPHTLGVTTWGERRIGDRLNLEVDLMARYAARLGDTVTPSAQ